MIPIHNHFEAALKSVLNEFITNGSPVKSFNWQSMERTQDMYEVQRMSFSSIMPNNVDALRKQIKPNLPWADDHFIERIGGEPLNPGNEYKNWPFYKTNKSNDKFRTAGEEQFSHTYMERIWPKLANQKPYKLRTITGGITTNEGTVDPSPHHGIRYTYGDFKDVINLLQRDPYTRQAYLPIWFPEDTGAIENQRVPCTLGYLFTRRHEVLNITYYIRSCDYLRHFRDDVYLACRKLIYVLDELRAIDLPVWQHIQPGIFTMHIESLHVFLPEYKILKDEQAQ